MRVAPSPAYATTDSISNIGERHSQQVCRDCCAEPSVAPIVDDDPEVNLQLLQLAIEALNENAMIAAASFGRNSSQIV